MVVGCLRGGLAGASSGAEGCLGDPLPAALASSVGATQTAGLSPRSSWNPPLPAMAGRERGRPWRGC